jgi:putative flippase GtrA
MSSSGISTEAARTTVIRSWVSRQPEGLRQFVKFAIVGASSTILDLLSWNLLYYGIPAIPIAMAHVAVYVSQWFPGSHLDLLAAKASMASVISSGVVGTGNAFYWNRRWTFRAAGHDLAIRQMRRFLVVAYLGMGMRALIVYVLVPKGDVHLSPLMGLLYNGIAIVIVMFWNFFVNRFWTFRKKGDAPRE